MNIFYKEKSTSNQKARYIARIYQSIWIFNGSVKDYNSNYSELELIDCSGNTQDMLSFFAGSIKNICICVTDYASLTNDPNDLYNTLKLFKSVKEIAIDLGDKVEVFERYKLLRDRNNTALRKFKCRTG
ncbi:hypothetical protein INT48_000555, partial [Thamnidium elegans]